MEIGHCIDFPLEPVDVGLVPEVRFGKNFDGEFLLCVVGNRRVNFGKCSSTELLADAVLADVRRRGDELRLGTPIRRRHSINVAVLVKKEEGKVKKCAENGGLY